MMASDDEETIAFVADPAADPRAVERQIVAIGKSAGPCQWKAVQGHGRAGRALLDLQRVP